LALSGRFVFTSIRGVQGTAAADRNIQRRSDLGMCEFNECHAVKQSKAQRPAERPLRERDGPVENARGLGHGRQRSWPRASTRPARQPQIDAARLVA
jgi:hypothetical protein